MLKIENLTRKFGKLTAVDDLSLEIEAGDIMGFIGPNGAGKTTTIKMVATLLKPTSGCVYVDGIDVSSDPLEARRRLGYMPDFFGLYDGVMVWEYLDFFASAYQIPRSGRRRAVDDVLELTDLTVKRESFIESLSRGMKQRLCLAKTILHDPKLLLLDEPASGLDPHARIEIKELLKELRNLGKTILISSHILPELADFCNKIAIVEKGKLIVSGEVEAIMEQLRGGTVLRIRVVERQDDALEMLSKLESVAEPCSDDGTISVKYIGVPDETYKVLEALTTNGYKVRSFSEEEVDLEDIFLKVTRGAVA